MLVMAHFKLRGMLICCMGGFPKFGPVLRSKGLLILEYHQIIPILINMPEGIYMDTTQSEFCKEMY